MAYGKRVTFETLRQATPAQIGATYAAIGTALLHDCRIIQLTNASDGDVLISFDGVNDHVHLAASTAGPASYRQFNWTENQVEVNEGFFLAKGTIIYVKDGTSPPANGNVIVEVIYGAPGP